MRAAGVRPHLASQRIGARAATSAEAAALQERKGATVLTMERAVFDDAGRAVEYGNHLYRASIYSFEFILASR
jgi:GntR family transcriptional regulator